MGTRRTSPSMNTVRWEGPVSSMVVPTGLSHPPSSGSTEGLRPVRLKEERKEAPGTKSLSEMRMEWNDKNYIIETEARSLGPSERDERRTKGTNDMPFISLTLGPQPMIHSLLSANGCGRCLVSFVSRCALASGHSSPLPSAVSEAVKRR